jgi:hypothetical protein
MNLQSRDDHCDRAQHSLAAPRMEQAKAERTKREGDQEKSLAERDATRCSTT